MTSLYYVTESWDRDRTEIHYTKNIKSVFHHYAMESSKDLWNIKPSTNSGHILAHFRSEISYDDINITGSISKLNVNV